MLKEQNILGSPIDITIQKEDSVSSNPNKKSVLIDEPSFFQKTISSISDFYNIKNKSNLLNSISPDKVLVDNSKDDKRYIYIQDIGLKQEIKNDVVDSNQLIKDAVVRKVPEMNAFFYNNYLYDTTIKDHVGDTFSSAIKGVASGVYRTVGKAAIGLATTLQEKYLNDIYNAQVNKKSPFYSEKKYKEDIADVNNILSGKIPSDKNLMKVKPEVEKMFEMSVRNNPEKFKQLENYYKNLNEHYNFIYESVGLKKDYNDVDSYFVSGEILGGTALSALGFFGKASALVPVAFGYSAMADSIDEALANDNSFRNAYGKSKVVGTFQWATEAFGISFVKHGVEMNNIVYGKTTQTLFNQFLDNFAISTARETSQEVIQTIGDYGLRKSLGITKQDLNSAIIDTAMAFVISPIVVAPFSFVSSRAKVKLSRNLMNSGMPEDLAIRTSEAIVHDGVELAANPRFVDVIQNHINATMNPETFDTNKQEDFYNVISKYRQENKISNQEIETKFNFDSETKITKIHDWIKSNKEMFDFFKSPEGFDALKKEIKVSKSEIEDDMVSSGIPTEQAAMYSRIIETNMSLLANAYGMPPRMTKELLLPKIINQTRLFMYDINYRNKPIVPSDIQFKKTGNIRDMAERYVSSLSDTKSFKDFIIENLSTKTSEIKDFNEKINYEYSSLSVEAINEERIRKQMPLFKDITKRDAAIIAAMKRLGASESDIYKSFFGSEISNNNVLQEHYKAARNLIIPELSPDEILSAKVAKEYVDYASSINDILGVNFASGIIVYKPSKPSTLAHELFHSVYLTIKTADMLSYEYNFKNKDIQNIVRVFNDYISEASKTIKNKEQNPEETLAVSFEKYLESGKAPTPELQSAFNSFKSWAETIHSFSGYEVPETDPQKVGDAVMTYELSNSSLEAANSLRELLKNPDDSSLFDMTLRRMYNSGHQDALAYSYQIKNAKNTIEKKMAIMNAEIGMRSKAFAESIFGGKNEKVEQIVDAAKTAASDVYNNIGGTKAVTSFIQKSGEIVSSTIKRISPKLHVKLEKNMYDRGMLLKSFHEALLPFDKNIIESGMSEEEKSVLFLSMLNGNNALIDSFAKQYKFEEELSVLRDSLNAAYSILEQSNSYSLGYIRDYFPRRIIDTEGLAKHLFNDPDFIAFRSETDPENKMDIKELLNQFSGLVARPKEKIGKVANIKERKIKQLTAEMSKFYENPLDAMASYFEDVADVWAIMDMFGDKGRDALNLAKDLKEKGYLHGFDNLLKDLGYYNNLNEKQKELLTNAIESIYFRGNAGKFDTIYRTTGSIVYLGNFFGAISNLGDFVITSYNNGLFETLSKAIDIVSADISGKKRDITVSDIGIIDLYEEFKQNKGVFKKAFDFVFKWSGFQYLDILAKDTSINAAADTFSKDLKSGIYSDHTNFMLEIAKLVAEGDDARFNQIISDLKDKKFTDDVKYLLFSTLSRQQPISSLEVPYYYNKYPNARLMYHFRTFGVKQINMFRDEILSTYKTNPEKALKDIFHFAILLMLAGVAKDAVRNFIKGKSIDMSDSALMSLSGFFFVNKYVIAKYNEDGVLSGGIALAMPPMPLINDIRKDINAFSETNMSLKDARTIRDIPLGGELFYWWFGGGSTPAKEKMGNELNEGESTGVLGFIKSIFSKSS